MELSEAQLLVRPETIELIDRLNAELPNPLPDSLLLKTVSELRASGLEANLVQAAMSQIMLRRKAATKFSDSSVPQLLTKAGLEQATREPVAQVHAERYVAAGFSSVADLGCGIGADALSFAAAGLAVSAVEYDPATALLTGVNLANFPDSSVICADAASFDTDSVDALWFDPARRSMSRGEMRRNMDPASWSPSLDFVFDKAKRQPAGIKLSPALDHQLIPDGMEAQWVSDRGEVVELTLWTGALSRPGVRRSALVLHDTFRHELTGPGPSPDEPVAAELGDYIFEPNGAIIRAELIGDLARMLQAAPVSAEIAYLTGNVWDPAADSAAFVQAFRIVAVLSARVDKLRPELKQRNIGTLEIKKRGIDIDPALFRKKLKLSGNDAATLIMTRVAGEHTALLVERLGSV